MKTLHRLLAATVLALVAPFLLVVPQAAAEDEVLNPSPQPCEVTPGCGDPCEVQPCSGEPPTCEVTPCPQPCEVTPGCGEPQDPCVAEALVEYGHRSQVEVLTAQIADQKRATARVEARADRQAATIQRLRAKLRALR